MVKMLKPSWQNLAHVSIVLSMNISSSSSITQLVRESVNLNISVVHYHIRRMLNSVHASYFSLTYHFVYFLNHLWLWLRKQFCHLLSIGMKSGILLWGENIRQVSENTVFRKKYEPQKNEVGNLGYYYKFIMRNFILDVGLMMWLG